MRSSVIIKSLLLLSAVKLSSASCEFTRAEDQIEMTAAQRAIIFNICITIKSYQGSDRKKACNAGLI